MIAPEPYLTKHFRREEFTRSETAARLGLANEPSPEEWENLHALAINVLEPAREALGGIRVTSGYRAPIVNWHVRNPGVPPPASLRRYEGGQHPKGEAVDVVTLEVPLGRLFVWLYQYTPFDQLIWEFDRWVHVSHRREGPQRGQVLRARIRAGRTVYEPMSAGEVRLHAPQEG